MRFAHQQKIKEYSAIEPVFLHHSPEHSVAQVIAWAILGGGGASVLMARTYLYDWSNRYRSAIIVVVALVVISAGGYLTYVKLIKSDSHEVAATTSSLQISQFSLLSPTNDATVDSPVTVSVPQFACENGMHWHLYVNGKLKTMVVDSPTQQLELPPGTHTIKVSLAGSDHQELTSRETTITVR